MKQPLSPQLAIMAALLGGGLLVGMPTDAAQSAHHAQNMQDAQIGPLPPEHSVGDVTYLSGGIGADEASAMKQAAPRYPLELMFVAKDQDGHDAYLAADQVIVRD